MSDDRSQPDVMTGIDDADTAVERIIPPEQPPMDDAAGGPTVDPEADEIPDTSTDDLSVQGGE